VSTTSILLETLRAHPRGLTLAELLARQPGLARRTVQRLVSRLIGDRQIVAHGAGRARRYFLVQVAAAASSADTAAADRFPEAVQLAPESQEVLAYVNRTVQARQPVGYQAEFLESYRPNDSFYLPDPLRRHLHRLGRTPQAGAAAGTYSRAILNRLLIDLSWASSHLEGNTYSRLDTRELIEQGRSAQGKAAVETQMILNHKAAIELLVGNIEEVGFDRYTVLNLHSALSENLLPDPADEGRVRRHPVEIASSVFRPLSVPQQIDALLGRLLQKADLIEDPFEQSFFVMVHLPYLQPFADINKRTSRLLANLPLFRANLCPLTFLDVPQAAYSLAMLGVYELTRVDLLRDLYAWAYERSTREYLAIRQSLAEPDPLRLAWRALIRQTVQDLVRHPGGDLLDRIRRALGPEVPPQDREPLCALIAQELQRLHEGVLARYGLRPSEYLAWKAGQGG
jgi:hypothetical protein